MNTRWCVLAIAAAWPVVVCATWATGVRVNTGTSGADHLSATADVTEDGIQIRASHRPPGGAREPGAHLHVRVVGDHWTDDVVRAIPPRSPRSRMRQPRDQIIITVPVKSSSAIREIRVVCVPWPHDRCVGSI